MPPAEGAADEEGASEETGAACAARGRETMLLVQKSLLAILALRRGNDRAAGVRSRDTSRGANISFGRQAAPV
jgi:hypothetical protein|tara:strand:+ start:2038 stop:2256 length:219 start_codon:yes stop_codon:yes gene_type:complete